MPVFAQFVHAQQGEASVVELRHMSKRQCPWWGNGTGPILEQGRSDFSHTNASGTLLHNGITRRLT